MSDRRFLQLYKKLVAKQLPLSDNPEMWKQRDMEALAALIEQKSGVKLSLSTLKRLWKPGFDQTPHPSTLDALVSVLGCRNWWDFKERYKEHIKTSKQNKPTLKRLGVLLGAGLVAVLIVGILANNLRVGKRKIHIGGPIAFEANKTVSQGVPNTVIFKYKLDKVNADSFFIQQSWNEVHREPIQKNSKNYSTTYYTPGFHRAKLLAGDSILVQSKVHITTDGWMALVRRHRDDLVPIYIREPGITKGGALKVSESQLLDNGVDTRQNFTLSFHNVREFEGLHSDNFNLKLRLKVDSIGNYACPETQITILCEEHIFFIPLTSQGCVGNVAVKFGEVKQDGKSADLSAFGTEIYQWQDLEITVADKKAQVSLNQKVIYNTQFLDDFGLVMGLVVSFTGAGSLDHISLVNSEGKTLLEDQFP